MDDNDDLVSALRTIRGTFDALQIRYFVGGSVASSFHGAMRSTMDVDIVADLSMEHVQPVLSSVAKEYYVSEPAIRDAIRRRSSFNLIHLRTSFKIDIFIGRGRRFDESSFARASIRRLGTAENGIDVPIASVEDILLAKLDWYLAGHEVSERQWDDVSRLVRLNRESLDWSYLESAATEIRVSDLLERLRNH
jgi:hypothetical protein